MTAQVQYTNECKHTTLQHSGVLMFAFLYELSFVSHQIQTTHHHYLKGAQELWIEHGPLVWTYVRASSDVRLLITWATTRAPSIRSWGSAKIHRCGRTPVRLMTSGSRWVATDCKGVAATGARVLTRCTMLRGLWLHARGGLHPDHQHTSATAWSLHVSV